MSTTIARPVNEAPPSVAKPRTRSLKLLGAAAVAVLTLPFMGGPASATATARSDIPGGYGEAVGRVATACATSNLTITLYYARAITPGQEVGGNFSAAPGTCRTRILTDGSRYTHFHVCNSNGFCGPEMYL